MQQSAAFPAPLPLSVPDQPKHSNVFVRGLPLHLSEEDLRGLFAQYGSVETCRLVVDLKTGASRGYGFVNLQTVEQASAAISSLNGTILGDRPLEVRLADAEPKDKLTGQQPSNNLYIRNLPLTTRDSELGTLFAPFGTVLEKKVLAPVEGARGAGALVRMATQQEAAAAIEGLHNRLPLGSALPLLLRYADTPEEKARKIAKRDRNGMAIQHVQPGQASLGQGPQMQQAQGGIPMQQPYTGFVPSQQGPPAANGASFPMQQSYMQQQQQQQPPQQLPALNSGMQQPQGLYQPQNQGFPSSMQPQPTLSEFSSPAGAPIPGLSGAVKQEPGTGDLQSGFGALGIPGGMNGLYMPGPGSAGPAVSNSMGGGFMPAAAPAGPAGPASMNGSFMPASGPVSGSAPFPGGSAYAAGAPFMQGYDQSAGGMGPMGPMGPGMQQTPDFGPPGQMPMQQQQQQGGAPSSLYVKNLPQEADKLYLYERFAPHGAILGIKVLMAPETGKCKGVAFVNYATNDAAMTAVGALHGTKIGDKVLHVSIQMFRGQRS
ncbi:hypothetical protein WJX84_011388 [Apatococcus fuscideae]|uniref:RRM domain-containing protein n=1 Tax=Apatococcus fuscideae TaxID=2026836 RepID=A0AAW1SPF4_9CHLO